MRKRGADLDPDCLRGLRGAYAFWLRPRSLRAEWLTRLVFALVLTLLLIVQELPVRADPPATGESETETEMTSDEVAVNRQLGQLVADSAKLDEIAAAIDRQSQRGSKADVDRVRELLRQARSLLDEITRIENEIGALVGDVPDPADANASDTTPLSTPEATAPGADRGTAVPAVGGGPGPATVSNLVMRPAAFRKFRLGRKILSKISSTLHKISNVIDRVSTVLIRAAERNLPEPLRTVVIQIIMVVTATLTGGISLLNQVTILLGGCGSSCGPPCNGASGVPGEGETALRVRADAIVNLCYSDFVAYKRAQHPVPFNWTDDGCTGPKLENLLVYDSLFNEPCQQHDFGYRNYGASGTLRLGPDDTTRAWIDSRLFQEMNRLCSSKYNRVIDTAQRAGCLALAQKIYSIVRSLGGSGFYGSPGSTDTTAPQLVELSFAPPAVDTSVGAASVTLTARVTDNLSGVVRADVAITSPSGSQSTSARATAAERVSGSGLDGVYRFTLALPSMAEQGTWHAAVSLLDAAGNEASLSSASLAVGGFPSVLQNGPTSPQASLRLETVASATSGTWISVHAPFTGDVNQSSSTRFEYATTRSGPWSPACGNGRPGESDWRTCTVTGLTPGTDYYIRTTTTDPDGVDGTNPNVLGPVPTAGVSVVTVAPSSGSVKRRDTHLLVAVPVAGDSNTNSTFTVSVGPSHDGPWTPKCGPENTYLAPKLCRIHGLTTGIDYWVHIEVADPDGVTGGLADQVIGPTRYVGRENLAIARAITADPGWGCCPSPSHLVDGRIQNPAWNYGFAWTGGTDCWAGGCPSGWKQATIDLAAAHSVDRVEFWTHDPGGIPRSWKVEVSTDGATFTEVFSTAVGTCRPSDTESFTDGPAWYYPSCSQRAMFSPVSARWVRYSFDDRTLYGGIHGWATELEIFGA